MSQIANEVFDAGLNYIKNNVNRIQLRTSASGVLVNKASGINGSDFGSPGDYGGSGGGRAITCLTGSDFQGLAVSTGGNAYKLHMMKSSTLVIEANVASPPVVLGSSDQVNIGSFQVILKDPTP